MGERTEIEISLKRELRYLRSLKSTLSIESAIAYIETRLREEF